MSGGCATIRPRGVILPTVLVILALLILTVAGFTFFIRAETQGTVAFTDQQQARAVAESALEEFTLLLRPVENRHDVTRWFDVPTQFRHVLVWSEDFTRVDDPVRQAGSREEILSGDIPARPAWRYSLVAPRFGGAEAEDVFRFGATPEASKLNLNTATEEQIRELLTPLLLDLGITAPEELIAALLDWRDEDEDLRDGGAETEYYETLDPPYLPKNGPLDTIEELLMVRGFSAAVLYGEDVNRNGLLDANEDDGEESFPPYDNGDGVLNHGIAPFLTVWSREPDTALDNQQRVNLNAEAGVITAQFALLSGGDDLEEFEEGATTSPEVSQATIGYIMQLKQQGFDFSQLGSPADLYVGPETRDAAGAVDEDEQPVVAVPAELLNSPVPLEDVPGLMNRCSVRAADGDQQAIFGLININTAPRRVLLTIPGMTAEAADALIAARLTTDREALLTPAWPLTTETIDDLTFRQIAPYITTKAYQFHVEIVAYADHTQQARRFEWLIEMVGPLAQIKYHRELTSLGIAWPVDRELSEITLQELQ